MFTRKGQKLGSVLAEEESTEPQPEPEPEERTDGIHNVGGGWHEVVIDGDTVDKVRGADAAQEAYEAYQQSEPDEEESED